MKIDEISWISFERDLLPSALFGKVRESRYGQSVSFGAPRPEAGRVAVGYIEHERLNDYKPPSVIVIDDATSSEMFSWLRTYAPETWPLSQFARVVTGDDWRRFQQRKKPSPQREDRWACLVLGEVLAQGDSDVELSNIPLSRASACFSMAVARTAIIHGTDESTTTCVERLLNLEADRRFVRRPVSVADLNPAWAIITSDVGKEMSGYEAAVLVVDLVSKFGRNSIKTGFGLNVPMLRDYPGLLSDSVEERVVSYQKLSNELINSPAQLARDVRANATLAAAAFLVGRSTSHYFMLRRSGKLFASSFAWFGLMAALAGPAAWDTNWARAAKGVERLLRAKFEWTDAPSIDMCWPEYSWMSTVFEGVDVFKDVPKMFPRVLSIEVVPGATCQLRFTETPGVGIETEQKQRFEPSLRESELETALAQFIKLAMKTRHIVESAPSTPPTPQQPLSFEEPNARPQSKINPQSPLTRIIRTKGTKRNPSE